MRRGSGRLYLRGVARGPHVESNSEGWEVVGGQLHSLQIDWLTQHFFQAEGIDSILYSSLTKKSALEVDFLLR